VDQRVDYRVARLVVLAAGAEAVEVAAALAVDLINEASNSVGGVAGTDLVRDAVVLTAAVSIFRDELRRVINRRGLRLEAGVRGHGLDNLQLLGERRAVSRALRIDGLILEAAGVARGSQELLRLRQVELEVLGVGPELGVTRVHPVATEALIDTGVPRSFEREALLCELGNVVACVNKRVAVDRHRVGLAHALVLPELLLPAERGVQRRER